MASGVFDFAAEQLERRTDLDRLEARGTLRIALKGAGLDARDVGSDQMAVVVGRVLPGELATRGVDAAEQVCQQILKELENLAPADADAAADSPETIFRRLARS
jgi:hypothetical protein